MNDRLVKKNLKNTECDWWLRSACSNRSDFVGSVDLSGFVDSYYTDISYGVLQVCFIV